MEIAFTLDPVEGRGELRHPRLRQLYDAWIGAAGPGGSPAAADILMPAALTIVSDEIWWLDLAMEAGRPDFIGRRFGRHTMSIYGIDPTGRRISEFARQPVFARIMRVLGTVASTGRPHRFTAEQSVMSDGGFMEVEALALPVTGPDGHLSGVLGATMARPF